MNNDTINDDQSTSTTQGILFKRRDVFRQIWRPRWFNLSPQDAVMTYHLLSRNVGSHHHATSREEEQEEEMQSGVDYDVAPRGTIYLGECSIEANERLTRPQDNLYVFTITPPLHADSGPCFLATTSLQSRNEWIQKLASACGVQQVIADDAASIATTEQDFNNNADEPSLPWITAPSSRTILAGVPKRLAQRIDNAIACYLPLLNESRGWKLFQEYNQDVVTAYERKYNHCFMLKTVARIPFPPKQVFALLVDCARRRDFETNVRHDERLKEFGTHTFLDYYAYQAVWPTLARDFGVVLHWRVITRASGSEKEQEGAILMLAFSDDAVDELQPPASDHVRADLKISLYLIQPVSSVDSSTTHSLVTRILSFDLCGNVPKSLTSKVVQQQATMPLVISQHLQETESTTPEWLAGSELSDEGLERDVIAKLSEPKDDSNHTRRPKYPERGESLLLREDSSKEADDQDALPELSLSFTALLLLTPLVLWSFANSLDLPGKETYFLLASVLAVRAVVLSNLGLCYDQGLQVQQHVDTITCRFSVDLKGVLRFIANRKEEQEEEQIESTEVSVIHIVIAAIAVAMGETAPLKCRRVFLPFLGIDGYYFSRKGGVDISLLVPSVEDGKQDDVYTLNGIGSKSVQNIADRILEEQEQMNADRTRNDVFARISRLLDCLTSFIELKSGQSLGTCLVIASPDHSEHGEVDIDAAPLKGSGINVTVVVGGVRLVRDSKPATTAPAGRPTTATIKPPPKPTLSMSITIDSPICSVASSRRFAERVQQLVQFPEMCED